MSDIVISPAEMDEAVMLKNISINAFKSNFEKYGLLLIRISRIITFMKSSVTKKLVR